MKISKKRLFYMAILVNIFAMILWSFMDNRYVVIASHLALIMVVIYFDRKVIKDD